VVQATIPPLALRLFGREGADARAEALRPPSAWAAPKLAMLGGFVHLVGEM